jgi:hypothetical protein
LFFLVWFYAKLDAVTALHGLMRWQVCDVKENVMVARYCFRQSLFSLSVVIASFLALAD